MNKTYTGNYSERDEGELPDPPENPEFEYLDPELQTVIAERFERGIALTEARDNIVRHNLLDTQASNVRKQRERATIRRDLDTGRVTYTLEDLGNVGRKRSRKPVRS